MSSVCKDCKAPKRYPGCSDHCPDRIAEKLIEELRKEAYRKEQDVSIGIRDQRTRGVTKANRRRKGGSKYDQ
jgi:hypothetical protein